MFGGHFGSFRSRDRHFFDESTGRYRELGKILAIRKKDLALRRGRQYLRPISEDGVTFWYPERIGAGKDDFHRGLEPDPVEPRGCLRHQHRLGLPRRTAWVTIDAGLHSAGDKFQCVYSTDQSKVGSLVAAEPRNGLAIRIEVPPAGFVIMAP